MANTYTPIYNDNTNECVGVMVRNEHGSFFVQRERIAPRSAYNRGVNGSHMRGEIDRDIERMMWDNRMQGV